MAETVGERRRPHRHDALINEARREAAASEDVKAAPGWTVMSASPARVAQCDRTQMRLCAPVSALERCCLVYFRPPRVLRPRASAALPILPNSANRFSTWASALIARAAGSRLLRRGYPAAAAIALLVVPALQIANRVGCGKEGATRVERSQLKESVTNASITACLPGISTDT